MKRSERHHLKENELVALVDRTRDVVMIEGSITIIERAAIDATLAEAFAAAAGFDPRRIEGGTRLRPHPSLVPRARVAAGSFGSPARRPAPLDNRPHSSGLGYRPPAPEAIVPWTSDFGAPHLRPVSMAEKVGALT